MWHRRTILSVCFFVSGASTLIYEIVWQRMLTLVFGLTTFSIAAVLSAFLAGLVIGSRWAGGWADRTRNVVRLYATIEAGIAITGLGTLLVIPLLMTVFIQIYGWLEPGWFLSNLVRFVLAVGAIGVPSVLIGATMPVMSRMFATHSGSTAVGFGRVYAVNTAGAVGGAALAGFVLIRFLGMPQALLVAVLGNAAAAILAVLARADHPARQPQADTYTDSDNRAGTTDGRHADTDGRTDACTDTGTRTDSLTGTGDRTGTSQAALPQPSLPVLPAGDHDVNGSLHHPRFALIAAFVAGVVSLVLEVAWVRLVTIYTLSSVYVFTMVVTVFLAATAAGTAVATRGLRTRRLLPLHTVMLVQLALGLATPVLLATIPYAVRLNLRDGRLSGVHIFWTEYALAAAVVFVPTVLIGMTLPMLVRIYAGPLAEAGRRVGRIYAANALGNILGAATGGVVLIPLLGIRQTLLLTTAGSFAVGAAAASLLPSRSGGWRAVAPAAGAVLAVMIALLPGHERFLVPSNRPDERILHYAEGPSATVHVAEYGQDKDTYRALYVDSHSVAGTYDEIVTDQKMLAHLPILLHRNPQRVLTVGFGTGGTSYSMLLHRVNVECAEIEPQVPRAYSFFETENHGVVGPNHDRNNFRLILEDARAWLQVAPHDYDVIVTDVTAIQYRGNGNLYTTDYFRLMQERLGPEGIAAAWVPITGIKPVQLKVLLRSFQSVFEHTSVWYMLNLPTDFVIVIGTPHRLAIDLADIAERSAKRPVARDLAVVGLDNPLKLAACLLFAEDEVSAYTGAGPVHTDNRPILDYLTHASPYRNTLAVNLRELMGHRGNSADYVVRWPASSARGDATWPTWRKAAGYLLEGHVLLNTRGEDDPRPLAAAQYHAASQLVPDDSKTRQLYEELQ